MDAAEAGEGEEMLTTEEIRAALAAKFTHRKGWFGPKGEP